MSASNAGDLGSIPGSGRSPGEGTLELCTPAFLPGESHEWRSLVGYSPRGRRELDMTERLHHSPIKVYVSILAEFCLGGMEE